MGSAAGIGGFLGAIGGSLLLPGIGTEIGGGLGSLIGGLFGGTENIDTAPYTNRVKYLENKANMFYNPNSSFYSAAIKNQKASLLDALMAGVRNRENQLSAHGIESNVLNSVLTRSANEKAINASNIFGNNLFRTGLGFAGNLESNATNTLGILSRVESNNADTNNSFNDSFMKMGSGILGNYLSKQSNSQPNYLDWFGNGHLPLG